MSAPGTAKPLTGPCLIYARSDGPWSITVQSLDSPTSP